jgi:predicted membrane protein
MSTLYFIRLCSLLLRFVEDDFDPNQTATVGVDLKTKETTVDDNTVKLKIWVNLPLVWSFSQCYVFGLGRKICVNSVGTTNIFSSSRTLLDWRSFER